MSSQDPLLTPREAAAALGISFPTIKQWILRGKINTIKTPGGHHRVPTSALDPYLRRSLAKPQAEKKRNLRRISGRNQLAGRIVELKVEGLLAKVVLSIGEQRIVAIITADAARDLALKKGETAVALIKATEVMIVRP